MTPESTRSSPQARAPERRMTWQAATLLIAGLSLGGWAVVILITQWLIP